AGKRRPRQSHDHQIINAEIGCTANDVARYAVEVLGTDVDLACPDGFLELGEFLDLDNAADRERARDGTHRDDLLDLVPDPDEGLLELLGRHIPTRGAGPDHVAEPAVGNAHQAPTPNGKEKRTSPSTMSRMSGIPLRNCRVRSSPMPNAKPEYSCGSMPHARKTFGFTMPQPPHSTQPGPPFLFGNQTSTSADGSVNGKKCGRNRVRPCGPNSERANASSVPRRWAIVRPLSTASPSTWWNTGVWVASSSSVRKVLPIEMMYTGRSRSSSARICTGEVWVRNTWREPSGAT